MEKTIKDLIDYLERAYLRAWIAGNDCQQIKNDLVNLKAQLNYLQTNGLKD